MGRSGNKYQSDVLRKPGVTLSNCRAHTSVAEYHQHQSTRAFGDTVGGTEPKPLSVCWPSHSMFAGRPSRRLRKLTKPSPDLTKRSGMKFDVRGAPDRDVQASSRPVQAARSSGTYIVTFPQVTLELRKSRRKLCRSLKYEIWQYRNVRKCTE